MIITWAKSILLQQVRNLIHERIVKRLVVDYIEAAQGKRIILRTIELQRLEAVTLPPSRRLKHRLPSRSPQPSYIVQIIRSTIKHPVLHAFRRTLKCKCISGHRFPTNYTALLPATHPGRRRTPSGIGYPETQDRETPLGMPRRPTYEPLGTASRFALVFLSSRFLRYVNKLAEPSLALKIPHPKIYIARRQTCPNCSSSCNASDHICYDSASSGFSFFTSVDGGIPSDRVSVCMCSYVMEHVIDFTS